MAYRIAIADAALTVATTWGAVDATSLLDSETATQVLATAASWTSGAAFVPGAITIDGIAVKIVSRSATPSGTVSIRLYDVTGGAAVAGTTVTVNVSDVPWDGANNRSGGWMFFKFAAPVLLVAAGNQYRVEGQTSIATMVTCDRDGTANNLSRLLRTTTTGAPAAGDSLFVLGEWTAAATKTNRLVTMDETAATDYGGASTSLASFGVSTGGTLNWGVVAATNYRFRLSGLLTVWYGGIYQMGTTGTPCPRDSSMLLEFDNAADGQFGPIVYGTFIAQGQSRTAAKLIWKCLLNTDEAVGQTILGVDTDSGWLNTDEIGIAPTARTYSQGEVRILDGAAAADHLDVTVGLTNAHSGIAPTQGEVVLLTRNVRIESLSSSFMSFLYALSASTVDLDWVRVRYIGQNVVGRRGIEIGTTTGSFNMHYCCVRDSEYCGVSVSHATAGDNYHVEYNTFWSCAGGPAVNHVVGSTGTAWSVVGNFVGGAATYSTYGIFLNTYGGTVNGNIITGTLNGGIYFNAIAEVTGTFDGNVIHSTNGYGIVTQAFVWGLNLTSVIVWRNAGQGLYINAGLHDGVVSGTFFGNATASIAFGSNLKSLWGTIFRNVISSGDSSFSTPSGIDLSSHAADCAELVLEHCNFSTAAGIKTAHTQDFLFPTSKSTARIYLRNTILAAATEFSASSNLIGRSFLARERVDGVTNVHSRVYPALGTTAYEATTFRTAAPSEKLTPSGATAVRRLRSSTRVVPVASGQATTLSVYVQKDAGYVGEAVRLVVRANPSLGLDADLVLDSMAGGSGVWEQLTGTITPVAEEAGAYEVYAEVTGSAGNVYVDDWAVTYA